MWTLFRVENEHCTNVGRFRASRDVPLPYDMFAPTPSPPEGEDVETDEGREHPSPIARRSTYTGPSPLGPNYGATTSSNLEAQQSASGSLRRRANTPNTPISRGIARMGTIMGQAHAQDFERKRRPVEAEVEASPHHQGASVAAESSDEEEEEDQIEGKGPDIRSSDDIGARGEGLEQEAEASGAVQSEEEQRVEEDMLATEEILGRHRSATAGGRGSSGA